MEKKKAGEGKRQAAPVQEASRRKAAPCREGQRRRKARRAEKAESRAPRTEKTEEELVDLTSRVYKLVVERGKDGVLQSEIWKELGLTSRDGSRLAIRLEKRGMIKRVKVLDDGRWTYKLTPLRLPGEHIVDGVGALHRLPRREQVLGDDRDQPVHLSADRALGHEGVRGLEDDGSRAAGSVAR